MFSTIFLQISVLPISQKFGSYKFKYMFEFRAYCINYENSLTKKYHFQTVPILREVLARYILLSNFDFIFFLILFFTWDKLAS